MKIYLLRHGETVGNVKGLYAGITDTPLTEKGKLQAEEARNTLGEYSFEVVISSPLSRAVDTARIITEQEIILEEELMEMNFGVCEGLSYEEIQIKYPTIMEEWNDDLRYYIFPEGESMKSFFDRVIKKYDQIINQYIGKDILIVAHSGVIRSILAYVISEDFEHYWKYRVDNCKTAILEYRDGYVTLNALNL